MSAFICHPKHLSYTAKAIKAYQNDQEYYVFESVEELAAKLHDVNILAIVDRYGDKVTDDEKLYEPQATTLDIEPGQALNALKCYRYQACEYSDYESTREAKYVAQAIESLERLGTIESGEWEVMS